MKRAFVITKPIQYLIALTIREQLSNDVEDLIIINDFRDSQLFVDKIYKKNWNKVHFLNKKKDLLNVVKLADYEELYLDSDVGFLNYLLFLRLKIFNSKINLHIFEEGIGTYLKETYLYCQLKIALFKLFGIGTNFGSCIFTNSIYLYSTSEYLKLNQRKPTNVVQIDLNIESLYKKNIEYFGFLCNCGLIDKFISVLNYKHTCVIILGTWIEPHLKIDYLNESLKSAISEAKINIDDDFIIVKEHPNENRRNIIPIIENSVHFNENAPAEILVYHLLIHFNQIKIIHHESTVTHYVTNNNVKFYNY